MTSTETIDLLKAFEKAAIKTSGNLARIEAMTRQTASDMKAFKKSLATKKAKIKVTVHCDGDELYLGEFNSSAQARDVRKVYDQVFKESEGMTKAAIKKEVKRRMDIGLI